MKNGSDLDIASSEGGGVKNGFSGAQLGHKGVSSSLGSLKTGDVDIARGVGLDGIDLAVGQVG